MNSNFYSSGAEYIPKEVKNLIGNKNTKTKIYRIQANDSIINGCFYFGITNFMLKGKVLLDYNNLLSSNKYEKNEKKNTKTFSITRKIFYE